MVQVRIKRLVVESCRRAFDKAQRFIDGILIGPPQLSHTVQLIVHTDGVARDLSALDAVLAHRLVPQPPAPSDPFEARLVISRRQLRSACRAVEKDPSMIDIYPVSERIAVALILDRIDLLPQSYPFVLDAVDRLGREWLALATDIHRNGWHV